MLEVMRDGMNTKHDLTVGVEWKKISVFALPIMIGNLLQQLYNTVDGIVVGNFVSENALAAVGTCASLTMVFIAFAMGLSSGASIMVAQYFGAKRYDELKSSVSTTVFLLTGVGIVLAIIGVILARFLVSVVLNVEAGEIREMAVTYIRIFVLGLPFGFSYNAVSAILRAMGDSKATLVFLCFCSVLNLVLDLIFVIVFGWAVAGVAIATVISQIMSCVFVVVYIKKKYEILHYAKGEFVFDKQKCVTCLKLGVPTTLQQCVVSFGNVFLQRLVNSFGAVTMAAFTVGMRIENYAMIPILSFGNGLSTFTGQNTGAEKPERIIRGWRQTVVISFICCAIVCTLMFAFASPLSSLFGIEGESLSQAVEYIRFAAPCLCLFAIYMTTSSVLSGSGDVIVSMLCTLSSLVVRVSASYIFAYVLDMGYSSAWRSLPVGWTVCSAIAVIRFASGKWKTKGITKRLPEEAVE